MQGIEAFERVWLERFFAAPNALTWDALCNRSAAPAWVAQVTPWLDLFGQRANRVPVVLPVFDEQGPCMWYAAATDSHQASALSEELTSLIGPSYSDFLGHSCRCDSSHPIEAALLERFGQHVYRIVPQDEAARALITRAMNLYLGLLRRRPPTPDRTQQPFGKLRADFDRALLAGNEVTATQLLEALCASGRINAEQRKFLEIRFLAGLGRQQELAHNSVLLKAVMDLSLPPQTIADLIGALYETFVAGIESAPPHEVAAAFQRHIGKNFSALFGERKGIRQPNILKAFFLYEATRGDPDQARLSVIESAYPEDPQGRLLLQQWREQLLQSAESISATLDCTVAASQAILDDEYETAATLYLQALPAISAYSGLLRCFPQLEDIALAETVRDQLIAMPGSIAEQLSERDRKRLVSLGSAALVPSSASCWLEWAQRVADHSYAGKDLAVLNDSLPRWTIEDYLYDPVKCEKLAGIVTNADGKADIVFRHAFAQFVEFFVGRSASPVRCFVPLYAMLIKMVAWNGGATADELELVASLGLNFLGAVPDKQTYVDTVDDVCEILTANRAAAQIDWALNIAELLAIHPTPAPEAGLRFFVAAVDLAQANIHRLTTTQSAVIQLLARDFGAADMLVGLPAQEGEEEAHVALFAGLVGIYSLTEPAANRAREILKSMIPQARIEVNSDLVATERLRNLSAKADVFVFAWRSSKHQAYFCVKDSRGDRPISMPTGKGAASIIQAVLTALA